MEALRCDSRTHQRKRRSDTALTRAAASGAFGAREPTPQMAARGEVGRPQRWARAGGGQLARSAPSSRILSPARRSYKSARALPSRARRILRHRGRVARAGGDHPRGAARADRSARAPRRRRACARGAERARPDRHDRHRGTSRGPGRPAGHHRGRWHGGEAGAIALMLAKRLGPTTLPSLVAEAAAGPRRDLFLGRPVVV